LCYLFQGTNAAYDSKIPQDWKIWKFLFVDPSEQIDWRPMEATQNLKAMNKRGVTAFSVNPRFHSSVLCGGPVSIPAPGGLAAGAQGQRKASGIPFLLGRGPKRRSTI